MYRKKSLVALLVFAVLLTSVSLASALTYPRSYPDRDWSRSDDYVWAQANQRLALNSGPGTRRFFQEYGHYGSSGDWFKVYAKAWDPNNGIYWFKVEYPGGFAWTGKKRFYASSFNEDRIPTEYWY